MPTLSWSSVNAVRWLGLVLSERFGIVLQLSNNEGKLIRLSVEGNEGAVDIVNDTDMFNRADSELPLSTWDGAVEGWDMPLDLPLPAPGTSQLNLPLITQTESSHRIDYDILGLTYWMLSRQEEVGRTDLDNHGRFPATSSHAYKHGYLERPIVDEWLNILGQVIRLQWPGLKIKQHQFSMKVSHDVDCPSRYGFRGVVGLGRTMFGTLVKRSDLGGALRAPSIWWETRKQLHPQDDYNTFDWIMDLSEQHGMTSSFYFICGRTAPKLDALYDPEQPAIRYLMRCIHARGHEIGLHPSYNSYQNPEAIVAEANRLRLICAEGGIEQNEWGGRMHFLRWEQPATLRAWEAASMTYDSTLGYADRPGFRCGTCYEYMAFDPVDGKALKLRLRPLVAMESTVMAGRYMNLGASDAAFDKFYQLKTACRYVGGVFTLLWHNSELSTAIDRELYRAIIQA